MDARLHLSLVSLGVDDIPRATSFYEALGARLSPYSVPETLSVFALGGVALALYDRRALADDALLPDERAAFGGITLAWNHPSRDAVDLAFARALTAGGRALKPPREVFWGGYSGYFADLDGHPWEIAHNPFWPIDAEGRIVFP